MALLMPAFQPPARGTMHADAGVPAHCYEPGRGKKWGIQCPETGKKFGQTNVSDNSPAFFRQHIEDNREFFEKQGFIEKTYMNRDDPTNLKMRAAGVTSVERQKGANWAGGGARKHHIKSGVTGEVHAQNICAPESPRWFQSAYENNPGFYTEHISPRQETLIKQKLGQQDSRNKNKISATGQVCSNTLNSPHSPDWMKAGTAANKKHFGAAINESYFKPNEYAQYESGTLGKKPVITRTEKGDNTHAYILSKSCPKWMRSPLLSNKEYFEKATNGRLAESYVEAPDVDCQAHGKRKNFRDPDTGVVEHTGGLVSHDQVPQWMNSPLASTGFSSSHAQQQAAAQQQRKGERSGKTSDRRSARGSQTGSQTERGRNPRPQAQRTRGSETERGRTSRTQGERPRGSTRR